MKKILADLFRDIFEFHKRALHVFQRPNWKLFFAVLWPQFQNVFVGIIEDIQQKTRLVESQASAIEYEKAAQDRVKIDQIARDTRLSEQMRRKKYLIDWLALPKPYYTDHDRHRSVREGSHASGRWLLNKARFRAWYDRHSANTPSLWITGKPGTGINEIRKI